MSTPTRTVTRPASVPVGGGLRRLYLARFAFALVWAALVIVAAGATGPLLTVLLVVYPLVDAAAVFWQLRSEGPAPTVRIPEWINVVVSVAAAVLLGWASTVSIAAVLTVWGIWALASGLVQLVAAVLRRGVGGQVPLIVSGAISALAGIAFTAQGLQGATSAAGIGGYAALGGIFFLVAGIRLAVLARRAS